MTAEEALGRLRAANVPEPGWHLRRLQAAGGDLAVMVERVCEGEPVHRVIGRREFHGLDLALGPETLEPRDDTEALVALAAEHAPVDARLLDLGTGTGAVALALLVDLPRATALMTDANADALRVARANAEANGFSDRVRFALGSWLEPVEGRFDAIVSNPPYIASATVDALDPAVRLHDPRLALDGGQDGLDAYRAILAGAAAHLVPGGFLALEIGYDQLDAVTRLAGRGGWRLEEARRDLGGRDRAVLLRPQRG